MRSLSIALILLAHAAVEPACGAEPTVLVSKETKQNNLVSKLLEVASISKGSHSFPFTRARDGWIFIAVTGQGKGTANIFLDKEAKPIATVSHNGSGDKVAEAMRLVAKGEHQVRVECNGDISVASLVVKTIPELMHCGLGFDPQIKAFGHYDYEFMKKDIAPNVTTVVVPSNVQLTQAVIDDWHGQGKKFVAEVGFNSKAKAADEHFKSWTSVYERAPFLDGVIVNEWGMNLHSDRRRPDHMERETKRHKLCEDAFAMIRADERFKNKSLFAYFGGSANLFNNQDTGKTFVRSIMNNNYYVALERYVFERSSEEKSKEALQKLLDGIADWEKNEPGVKQKMVIAFGLFSMPPGGINKLPNVDYHVWMDQQMNLVANHPTMADIAGLEWWTSILTDEVTVRFVGKLYRHYAIEGKTEMLTKDPLFTKHLQNADFENGTEGWTLQPAEKDSIQPKSFPRYGRIEMRFMGLGRPADPEHIGDTFLWMKRSEKGPNTFSQTIKDLQPGRLYSLEMFSCDYNDLVHLKQKTMQEATPFRGTMTIEGVELDPKRSFTEMYPPAPSRRTFPSGLPTTGKTSARKERRRKSRSPTGPTKNPKAPSARNRFSTF